MSEFDDITKLVFGSPEAMEHLSNKLKYFRLLENVLDEAEEFISNFEENSKCDYCIANSANLVALKEEVKKCQL